MAENTALRILGEADIAITIDRAEAMASALPQAEMVHIPGGGHAANLTHADLVNPPLIDFLRRVSPM